MARRSAHTGATAAPVRWWALRAAIARPGDSRVFLDTILGELAADRFSLNAWASLLGRSLERSIEQARIRPAAAAELTALHGVAAAVGGWRWAVISWGISITHLGLLGERLTLGWPNRLSLLRALLPALAPDARWTSVVAVATDLADGRLARIGGRSAFGAFADPIADGVFWSWFALRWESNRWLRWSPLVVFAAATTGIAATYFVRGRVIDYPRPTAIRYASACAQVLLTLRASRRILIRRHRPAVLRNHP